MRSNFRLVACVYNNALVNGQLTARETRDANNILRFDVHYINVNGKNIAGSWIWQMASVIGAIGRKTSRF
ncbi:hypothetical protein AUP40_06975 [Thalassospira xiamenensis]|uniref:Uncharacterized protein n=1 Tax=Thalassospira xiamenensis TaxID=220697 RepID=A0ABR5XW06_9PROT|nr:hypothetical protein AUP40_06975 [Thalassospira xiamenensis]